MERFQPIIGGDGGRGRGGHDQVPEERHRGASRDGGTPILVAGEEAGATLPFGCRMGICHTCVGQAVLGQGARPAHRRGLRQRRARWSAPASTRPRAPSRSSSRTKPERDRPRSRHDNDDREPARAPHRRADRGARQGVRRASTTRSSTTSATATARYITSMIELHRRLACSAACCCSARATSRPGSPARRRSRWPRSSRTWRSATTSCTASGTG